MILPMRNLSPSASQPAVTEAAPMNYGQVKQKIWRNAASNYLRTLIGMGVGLATFRLLYQGLSQEEFGFWSLLWSVFGYGILFDFGFGFAAQKRVAELSVTREWGKLSEVLSSVMCCYLGVALMVMTLVLAGSPHIISWFGVSAAHAEDFRRVLVLFFLGIGLAFPLGVFPEILRGQQRLGLANCLVSGAMILRLAALALALWYQASFMTIMAIALFFALAPDVLAAWLALREMPQVRLHPRLASWSTLGGTLRFSLFAYLGTATNMVLAKTDQLVIGATLSVAAVAIYQAGAKASEIFAQFTRQVQDTLSPAAAHLNATGDRAALRDLLAQSTRWSALIATPLYLLCAFYLTELLRVLTGERQVPWETWMAGQVLLAWHYSANLTHGVSKRIFMMTGHERRLMWLGVGEAVANLGLSIGLVAVFHNIVGVAVGSLLPTLAIGWFRLWPWMAREAGLTGGQLFRQAVWPVWLACLPMLALLLGLESLRTANHWLVLFTHGPAAALAALAGIWLWALNPEERARILCLLPSTLMPGRKLQFVKTISPV